MKNKKINADIERIDLAIQKNSQNEYVELYDEIIATYNTEVAGLEKGLHELTSRSDFLYNINAPDHAQIPVREYPENYLKNLKILKGKLQLHIGNDEPKVNKGININIDNKNANELNSNIDISINISFDDVKNQIRDMDNFLDEESINEILVKIDELESIINSLDKKSDKWKKARNIGKWIFDKSVDVGIALLPLFLKIQ